MSRRPKKSVKKQVDEISIILGVLCLLIVLVLLLTLFIDAPFAVIIKGLFGYLNIMLIIIFINLALSFLGSYYDLNSLKSLIGQIVLLFFLSIDISALLMILQQQNLIVSAVGNWGEEIGRILIDILSPMITFIIITIFTVLLVFPLAFNISLLKVKAALMKIGNVLKIIIKKFLSFIKKLFKGKAIEEKPLNISSKGMVSDLNDLSSKDSSKSIVEVPIKKMEDIDDLKKVETPPSMVSDLNDNLIGTQQTLTSQSEEGSLVNHVLKYPKWKLPPLDLLDSFTKFKPPKDIIENNKKIIESTLQSFGIVSKVVDAKIGPSVTQYALNIAQGTKVAKIANLKDDLSLALAVKSGIRIEAPIPGTTYVGIEFANPVTSTVHFKEIMEKLKTTYASMNLGVVIGKAIDGTPIINDLQKMPHTLIAGTTGSGKSVLTNTFIASLLMTKSPDELRFILIDPKQVEFNDFNGIPHLLTPVIVDTDKVLNSLKWALAEMEKRYTMFRQTRVRNLQGYNQLMGFSALPYIVIVVDEMADLMLSVGKEIENAIVRLAQKARATGIHLILATQRPSVDVITGLIKANIPSRIALKVATQVDSRVIIDVIGAESLLGRGDLLFLEPERPKPLRVQAVWISPIEIQRVVEFIKEQGKEVEYLEEVTQKHDQDAQVALEKGKSDNEFLECIRLVMQTKKASASYFQTRLSIGYNKAARIIMKMEDLGIVGPANGSKPRDVYMSIAEEYLMGNKKLPTELD